MSWRKDRVAQAEVAQLSVMKHDSRKGMTCPRGCGGLWVCFLFAEGEALQVKTTSELQADIHDLSPLVG